MSQHEEKSFKIAAGFAVVGALCNRRGDGAGVKAAAYR
jgi:hypothetical protein